MTNFSTVNSLPIFFVRYFFFFLIPLNSNVKKLSREADHNYKQFKISDNQLKGFNIDQLKSKLDSINKKINKFSQYKLDNSDLPKLLNQFAKIVSKPGINLTLLGIKQGVIRINKKSIVFKNKTNPIQSSSKPPSPPPTARNNTPPPPPVPSVPAPSPSQRKILSSKTKNLKSGEKIIRWKELPIYIEISGEFLDISEFFYYLNKIDKIIIVDSISMESDKMNTGKILCKINLIVLMGETNE